MLPNSLEKIKDFINMELVSAPDYTHVTWWKKQTKVAMLENQNQSERVTVDIDKFVHRDGVYVI